MSRERRLSYFGKLPSRADFVRDAFDQPLVNAIDQWLAQTMQLLQADPRWKLVYDAMPPMNFAIVGTRRRHALAGHLRASQDNAGRRFPFVLMQVTEVPASEDFLIRSPFVFAPLWRALPRLAQEATAAQNPATRLQAINHFLLPEHAPSEDLSAWTLGRLANALQIHDLPRLMVGLGFLLRPIASGREAVPAKSLALPMPSDGEAPACAAAFWLHLLEPCLQGRDLEVLQLYTLVDGKPAMVLGFDGASAATLHSVIDPISGEKEQVRFDALEWVAAAMADDPPARQLAAYLDQPGLGLMLARELFVHTFFGRQAYA